MIKVVELQNINPGVPSQWQGYDDDGQPIYVRYCAGYLAVMRGKPGDSIFSAVYGEEVFGRQIGNELSETLNFEQLRAATTGLVQWPETED